MGSICSRAINNKQIISSQPLHHLHTHTQTDINFNIIFVCVCIYLLKESFIFSCYVYFLTGRPVPLHFQSSFNQHGSTQRKSFTIPQTRNRHRHHSNQDEPLLSPTTSTPVIKDDTPPPPVQSQTTVHSNDSFRSYTTSNSQATIRSTSSEYSVDSRISSRQVPDDAMYPKGGIFGLADCMSTRSKEK